MRKRFATLWLVLAMTAPALVDVPAVAQAEIDFSQAITEGIINAPREQIWKVFATAEGFKALGVAQAKMDFRRGGLILSSYDPKATLGDEQTIQTEILAYDLERTLVTRIHQPPKGFPFMEAYKHVWTVITLTDVGNGRTHLRLAMNGYGKDEESQKMRTFFANGNEWVMKTLQSKYAAVQVPKGDAHAESPLGVIDMVRLVTAPRKDVWTALSTAGGWKAFFGVSSNIGSLPGEPFEPFPGTEGCKLLTVVPDELLSFTWSAPAKYAFAKEHPSWVSVSMEEVSPTLTRVRLRHLGFAELSAKYADRAADFKEVRLYFAGAWPKVLDQLQAHFGTAKK